MYPKGVKKQFVPRPQHTTKFQGYSVYLNLSFTLEICNAKH
jgi:hypothetical protein